VLSAAGLLIAGFMMPAGEGAIVAFTTIFSTIWWGVILFVGWAMVKGFGSGGGLLSKMRSLMGMIFLVPFVFGGLAVPAATFFGTGASWPMIFFIGGAVLLALYNFVFYWLLKAPTPKGKAILDQIEGFRMYMTTAEEERLKVLHPPEKTPELFERYLPYAIALDCENEWNAKVCRRPRCSGSGRSCGGCGALVVPWQQLEQPRFLPRSQFRTCVLDLVSIGGAGVFVRFRRRWFLWWRRRRRRRVRLVVRSTPPDKRARPRPSTQKTLACPQGREPRPCPRR
jgi:hypothetical protein